jgi:hypothetical protein
LDIVITAVVDEGQWWGNAEKFIYPLPDVFRSLVACYVHRFLTGADDEVMHVQVHTVFT